MKRVKRTSKKNLFRLSTYYDDTMWFDLWGDSYTYLTEAQVRKLYEALGRALGTHSQHTAQPSDR